MTMVEKVARAIYHGTPRNKPWEQLPPPFKAYWRKRGRAAVKAMREPTPEMLNEGDNYMPQFQQDGLEHLTGYDVADDVWRSMIDAAIKEQE